MKKNSRSQNKKSLYSLLVKWFTWQKVGVIFGGLAVVVPIVLYVLSLEEKESEATIVRNQIFEKISTIEATFMPESIPEELDSLPDVQLIKEFKFKSLKASSLWDAIEKTEPYLFHLRNGKHEADFVWETNIERERNLDSLYLRIEKIVTDIQCIAVDKNMEEYKLINYSKLFKFRDMMKIKSQMFVQASESFSTYCQSGDWEKAYKAYDDLRDNPNYYEFDKTFFDFILEANKAYDLAISKYKKVND